MYCHTVVYAQRVQPHSALPFGACEEYSFAIAASFTNGFPSSLSLAASCAPEQAVELVRKLAQVTPRGSSNEMVLSASECNAPYCMRVLVHCIVRVRARG